jgi:DNA-binding CsgD family transcriptional regulator
MSKSGRLRLSELRNAYRLIHECRDLGHDPAAWTRHAVEQLTRLAGAQVGVVAEFRPTEPAELPGARVFHDHGWSSPRHRAYWFDHDVRNREYVQAPTFQLFATLPGLLKTRRREQLVGDAEWYRSAEFQDMHRLLELDDLLVSGRVTNTDPLCLFGLVLFRPLGAKRHGERERRLVHLFHHELARYVGTALALEHGGAPALSPRLQQTLECLLEGDGEKQVAARLGLSRHTVHEYVGQLYRRFGVCSRPELLALCLRVGAPRTIPVPPRGERRNGSAVTASNKPKVEPG